VIFDLNGDGAKAVAKSIGSSATAVAGDVTSAGDVRACVERTLAAHGRLDIVVNNAGWTHRNRPLLEVSEAEFDKIYAVNVKSIYHMTRAVVPPMRRQGGGCIINTGSTAGIRQRPGLTWYNGSKGAVHVLSRSMAAELAPDKIRVNCVAPVIGETGLLESFMGLPDTPANRAKFIATIPLGRMSRPTDIANACLYLASDEAEFVTGVVLEVDGGRDV
jgi:3-oxoacyl-[acyl-carrier protein] reductase